MAKPFNLGEYVRQSTEASGVPEKVLDRGTLEKVARLMVPRLPKRSASKTDRTGRSGR
jgi:hypothetical protein